MEEINVKYWVAERISEIDDVCIDMQCFYSFDTAVNYVHGKTGCSVKEIIESFKRREWCSNYRIIKKVSKTTNYYHSGEY